MIKLDERRTELVNLHATIAALDEINRLIKELSRFSDGRTATCKLIGYSSGDTLVQIENSIMVRALTAQRNRLIVYLATLGVDAGIDTITEESN